MKRRESLRSKGLLTGLNKAAGDENASLTFKGLGVIFSRGDEMDFDDLHGDKFLPDVSQMRGENDGVADDGPVLATDYGIGDWLIPGKTAVPVTWDHGMGILGSKVLGEAVFQKLTDEGLEFLIHVTQEQAERYGELVEWAYDKGMLGLSSQTLSTMFDYDWSTGIIKRWRIGEMALTVTPADHRTRDMLVAQAKSLNIILDEGGTNMEEEIVTTAEDAVNAAEVDAVVTEEPAKTVEADAETVETEFDAEMDQVIEAVDGDIEEALDADASKAVLGLLVELRTQVSDLTAKIETMRTDAATKQDIVELTDEFDGRFKALQDGFVKGFRGLGNVLVKRIKGLAAETIAEASTLEIDAVADTANSAVQRSANRPGMDDRGVPLNMPGRN
jgi:hypothetical protein